MPKYGPWGPQTDRTLNPLASAAGIKIQFNVEIFAHAKRSHTTSLTTESDILN